MNIFYGRENLDKMKFLFSQVKIQGTKTYIIVPEQFTLEAEKEAFKHLETQALMDIEIISFSRLGYKVLKEVGGEKVSTLDKYGRYMLLSKIIKDNKDKLKLFRGMEKTPSFLEKLNDLFSEMKEFSTTPTQLDEITKQLNGTNILKQKLEDIQFIYENYEKTIEKTYLDGEDYTNYFSSKIKDSKKLSQYNIWIVGFEYFSPKLLNVIKGLLEKALDVNILLTWDTSSKDKSLFEITTFVINQLKNICLSLGGKYRISPIDDEYLKQKTSEYNIAPEVLYLEKELFSSQINPYDSPESKKSNSNTSCSLHKNLLRDFIQPIKLVEASNPRAEIESAAIYINALIREKGFKQKDIVILTNNLENYSHIFHRVFQEYNLNVFLDLKRNIMNHPLVEFITYLIQIGSGSINTNNILGLLKTQFLDFTTDEEELIENYAYAYDIKAWQWQKEFVKGSQILGEEAFQNINEIRNRLFKTLDPFLKDFKDAKTGLQKCEILYYYLLNDLQIGEQLYNLVEIQEQENLYEQASITSQIWNVFTNILEQISSLMADEDISAETFLDIVKEGFSSSEIGVLPNSNDSILIGSIKRTRIGNTKILMVLNANDGVLPATSSNNGVLSDDEKISLFNNSFEICNNRNFEIQEENLSIYRNFAKPTHHFYISCSLSDLDGQTLKPSTIFGRIKKIFPDIAVSKDIHDLENPYFFSLSKDSTLQHISKELKNQINTIWTKNSYKWLQEFLPNKLQNVKDGLTFNTKTGKISSRFLKGLYKYNSKEELLLSPSAMEKYSHCPFSHFINYGLKPYENRAFNVSSRELGDVYHLCLMKLSQDLTSPNEDITSPASKWMTCDLDYCENFINDFIDKELPKYREGVFLSNSDGEYRKNRLRRVCLQSTYQMITQVQKGTLEKMFFEASFKDGANQSFSPLKVNIPNKNNQTISIEGQIDRVDILPDNYAKIIDYKSGYQSFNKNLCEKGVSLQLILYLNAVSHNYNTHFKPAGAFYFKIQEPIVNIEGTADKNKIKDTVQKDFKLDGFMLNNNSLIHNIAGEFEGFSEVLPIRKKKDGEFSGNSLMNDDEFKEFQNNTNSKIVEICTNLVDGKIDVSPLRWTSQSACTYCQFHSICKFEYAFGCKYRPV